jgi:hypothetical protein
LSTDVPVEGSAAAGPGASTARTRAAARTSSSTAGTRATASTSATTSTLSKRGTNRSAGYQRGANNRHYLLVHEKLLPISPLQRYGRAVVPLVSKGED